MAGLPSCLVHLSLAVFLLVCVGLRDSLQRVDHLGGIRHKHSLGSVHVTNTKPQLSKGSLILLDPLRLVGARLQFLPLRLEGLKLTHHVADGLGHQLSGLTAAFILGRRLALCGGHLLGRICHT